MSLPRRDTSRAVRKLTALLAVAFLLSLLPAGSGAVVAATPVTVGYSDFTYGDAPGGDDVTADRSQSKLWFHDGRWFGVLFDPATTQQAQFRIHRFDMATQNWTNTLTGVDNRNRSHADALSVGNTLYIASARAESATIGATGRDLRIYKYSYNGTTKKYALVAGFPKAIASTAAGTGYSSIAQDTTGRLWVVYTQATTQGTVGPEDPAKVRVSSSGDAGLTWSAPIDLPNMGNDVHVDDVAAISDLSGGGTNGVGVLWSNQSVADDAFYFVAHVNGDPIGTWQARETAFGTSGGTFNYDADGHISLKKDDATGNLIAAVKTGRNDDPAPNGGDPLIAVLKRTGSPAAAGTWTNHEVTDVNTEGTRPILVLDAAAGQANVFLTFPTLLSDGQQSIYRRTAPLATLNFGAPSLGSLFISSATETAINDATSSKQMASVASGILVEAANVPTLRYLHNCAGAPCPTAPVANFTANQTTGQAPLLVQFTDTSTNTPTSWSWTFGDGTTSTAQNPSHQFADPGTYAVSLTATNVAGSDVETKAGFITVQPPPDNLYATVSPVRVLDTRPGINTGLTGAFPANQPRFLSIAGANGIPADAVAITGNLTVVGQARAGFISITTTSQANPTTSNLNFPVGDTRANGVTVPLNGSGDIWIVYKASGGSAHVLLDITGYFRETTSGKTFFDLAPVRVLDSRVNKGLPGVFQPNVPRRLDVAGTNNIPANAQAITGNLTVVGQTRAGYLSITPNSTVNPTTSMLNFPLGDVRANGVTVPLNGSGDLWIVYKASGGSTHVILDVTGYFIEGTTGKTFVPVDPSRILDTRNDIGLPNKFNANTPRAWDTAGQGGVGSDAIAVIGNVTVTEQTKAGYVSLTPTNNANPTTSTINFPLGDNRANNFTVRLSGTGFLSAVYKAPAGAGTHLIVDITGYYK